MKKLVRRAPLLATLILGALLTACTQPSSVPSLTPEGFVTVSVHYDAEVEGRTADELGALGSPYHPTGAAKGSVAVDVVSVKVKDRNGSVVRFDHDNGTYVATTGGALQAVPLSKSASTASVVLEAAAGPYTFEALGRMDANGPVIAYDLRSADLTDQASVHIALKSVLGRSALTPRLPTTLAVEGRTLDLMLIVMTNGHDDFPTDYLQVPMSDFTVTYAVFGASILEESNRGLRLTVGSTCDEVRVKVTVTGLREETGTFVKSAEQFEFALPCSSVAGRLSADLVPPTLADVSYDPATGTLRGTADAGANDGISRLEVYDGPVRLATDTDGIDFTPGTNEFTAALDADLTNVTVVAYDFAGNQASWTGPVADLLTHAWVAKSGNDSNDGSNASPFGTLRKALSAVADGGTIYLGAGKYSSTSQITISRPVTIVGQPTSTDEPIIDQSAYNAYGLIVTANDVHIRDLTIHGPAAATDHAYGVKVEVPVGSTTPVTGFRMTNVTVKGSGKSEIDLNTVDGAQLVNVVADGHAVVGNAHSEGVGIAISGSRNILLDNVTTMGNRWGGVGLFGAGGSIGNPSDVTIRGGTFSDQIPVYSHLKSGFSTGGLSLGGFEYAVRNPSDRPSEGSFTYYFRSAGDAAAWAAVLDQAYGTPRSTVQLTSAGDAAILRDRFIVPEGLSLQAAIDAVTPGATIDFTGRHVLGRQVDVTKPVMINGAGAATTTVVANSPTAFAIHSAAAGATLRGFALELSGAAANYGIELLNPGPRDVSLEGITIDGTGNAETATAVKVESGADASGFSMIDVNIHDVKYGVYVAHSKSTPTTFQGVTFRDVTVENAADKGLYIEAIADALFEGVTVVGSGNVGNSAGMNGAGISLNIENGPAGNVRIVDSTITGSGGSPGGGGAALTLKASAGEVFSGVTIVDSHLTAHDGQGAKVALRVGDPGGNAPGPMNVTVRGGSLTGAEHALLNHTSSTVELVGVGTTGALGGLIRLVP